jgi:hypothetical protein
MELAELLCKFQNIFNRSDSYISNIISDGIVLQLKVHDNNFDYTRFIQTLKDIGEKQFQFICENKYFIRGGLSVGTKLESNQSSGRDDNHQFVSNGLARAVKIESSYVSWPVIGTNDSILSEIRELFEVNNDEEYFNLAKGFNIQGEELYFIDFLQKNVDFYQLLNKKIKDFEGTPCIQNNFFWLLRYYHSRFNAEGLDKKLDGVIL